MVSEIPWRGGGELIPMEEHRAPVAGQAHNTPSGGLQDHEDHGDDHEDDKEHTMSTEKKAKNTGESLKGKAKEAAGRTVGNERLTAEGKADQVKGDAKQAVEKVKDAFRH